MSAGVLYVADEAHVPEATDSATSAKRYSPEISAAICTDAPTVPDVFDHKIDVSMDEWDWDLRIRALRQTPFDRTLYLDTDTFVTADLTDLFGLLDEYEMAAALAPVRHTAMVMETGLTSRSIPTSFGEYNCGVLLYRYNDSVDSFLQDWASRFDEYRRKSDTVHDQSAFRDVVYGHSVRLATLPPEYNFRLPFHGYVSDEIKIVHGRASNPDYIASRLNSRSGPRVISCFSVRSRWEVLFGPGVIRASFAKAKLVAREMSSPEMWARTIESLRKRV